MLHNVVFWIIRIASDILGYFYNKKETISNIFL